MKLTAQHFKAIELLASGVNGKDTAEKLNLTQETISRWRADFDFQAELNKLLKSGQEAAQERLRYLSSVALETIEHVMMDSGATQKDRLTASFKILEITKLGTPHIGSTNAEVLKKEKEQSVLFELCQL